MATNGQIGSLVAQQLVVVLSHKPTNITHVVTGFAPDTAVDIERGEDAWSHIVGTHGFVSRSLNIDETAVVTLHLQQTANDNDILTRLHEYDKSHYRNQGLFTLSILDKSGRTALFSTTAFISKPPNQTFGTTVGTQDWVIVMPYADWHIGGNTLAGAEVQNALAQLGYKLDDEWKIN
jgi:hypothetical protein